MLKGSMGGLILTVAGLMVLTGCDAGFGQGGWAAGLGRPAVASEPGGMTKVQRYLPGDARRGAAVLLEKAAPQSVKVGETFEIHIKVTNQAKTDLYNVTVWDTVMPGVRVTKAVPDVTRTKNGWAAWEVGKLAPGQASLIKIQAVADAPCILKPCSEVTYRTDQVCIAIDVVE